MFQMLLLFDRVQSTRSAQIYDLFDLKEQNKTTKKCIFLNDKQHCCCQQMQLFMKVYSATLFF